MEFRLADGLFWEGSATAIAITHQDESAGDLHRVARLCRTVAQSRRLLAAASVMDGRSRTDAAMAAGMDRQSSRDGVRPFNAEGPSGLVDKPRSGRPPPAERGPVERTGRGCRGWP